MIHRYAYKAMSVTGSLHCVLGVGAFVTAIVGLALLPQLSIYYGVTLFVSLWILLVGCLGISAGRKTISYQNTLNCKIAYMVTTILSVAISCGIASWLYTLWEAFTIEVPNLKIDEIDSKLHTKVDVLRFAGAIITGMEFILAIVSSSICCCCSPTKSNLFTYNILPYQTSDEDEILFDQSACQLNRHPTKLRPAFKPLS